jgi:uncharacterized protein (TIGR02246 family)
MRALLFALLLPGLALADDPVRDIASVLDRFHAAAARADGEAYFGLFARDAVFIGTDASERWSLAQFRAYAEPFFAQGKGWTYRPRERHVTLTTQACACIAWFDELLDSASYGTSRGTGVMVLEDGHWKVAQYALTFPVPNDLADGITRSIKAFEARTPRR